MRNGDSTGERVRPGLATGPSASLNERRLAGWIGRSIRVEGKVISTQDLTIDGHVKGSIKLGDHSLTIGPTATITADLVAKNVTISGAVTGNGEPGSSSTFERQALSLATSSHHGLSWPRGPSSRAMLMSAAIFKTLRHQNAIPKSRERKAPDLRNDTSVQCKNNLMGNDRRGSRKGLSCSFLFGGVRRADGVEGFSCAPPSARVFFVQVRPRMTSQLQTLVRRCPVRSGEKGNRIVQGHG